MYAYMYVCIHFESIASLIFRDGGERVGGRERQRDEQTYRKTDRQTRPE